MMVPSGSLLTIDVFNPAVTSDATKTRASIEGIANPNTLTVTVTNVSGSSIALKQGAKFKLDFDNISLPGETVKNIQFSQPISDWSISATGTVLELIYQGGGFQWENMLPLEFTLGNIIADFEEDKVGTLTVEVEQIPGLANGIGMWKQPALLCRTSKTSPQETIQIDVKPNVLYITPPGIKNRLDFYIENKGEDIEQASIEISVRCGNENTDMVAPHDVPPVLTILNSDNQPRDDINAPVRSGKQLAWNISGLDTQLLRNSRVEFSLTDIVTKGLGETIAMIKLRDMKTYKKCKFLLSITKKDAPPEIQDFGILDQNRVTGNILVSWSTVKANTVKITLHEDPFLLAGPFDLHFDNVGDRGQIWIPQRDPAQTGMGLLLARRGRITLTAVGLGESIEKSVDWSY
jgi:hypothetical protein